MRLPILPTGIIKEAGRFFLDQAPNTSLVTTDLILAETWTFSTPIWEDFQRLPSGKPSEKRESPFYP